MNLIRFSHRARARFRSLWTRDRAPEDHTVLLVGSARSGTTWAERFLNPEGRARIVFEPFSPKRNPMLRGWPERPYLRPGVSDPTWVDPAGRILAGRVHNWWVDQYNRAYRPEGRIVKDVRALLMLKWLKTRFPHIPIVWVLRHPFAVASSRMAQGWGDELEELLAREPLVRDHLEGVETFINNLSDPFARQVAFWCVENGVARRMLAPGDAHIVFYEDCVRDPQTEFRRINTFLGRQDARFPEEAIRKPSPTSRKHGETKQRFHPLEAWKATTSEAEIREGMDVLRRFGLCDLYGEDPYPLCTPNHVLSPVNDNGPPASRGLRTAKRP